MLLKEAHSPARKGIQLVLSGKEWAAMAAALPNIENDIE